MPINNITQTISTIPEAPHRGMDVQTIFVTKQEDFQDHLQGVTVNELNGLVAQQNTMAVEMNSTATQVNTNANTATTQAGIATTKASEALTNRNQAETFAQQAQASANSVDANNIVRRTGAQTIDGVKTFSSNIVGNITGNSGTATKLQTARTINGVSFDGTANITISDSTAVKLTGNQTIAGIKTFTSSPIVPKPTTDFQVATKKYVDDAIAIDSIDDLATYTGFGQVIVKDINRGGVFVSKTVVDIDPNTGSLYTINGGTVFAKSGGGFWVRQYSGAVNVKWFDTPKNYSDFAKNFIPDGASKFNYYPNGDFSTGTYTIIDGVSESKHYHGTNLCEGYDGKIHMTYRVGTAHHTEGHWSLCYRNSSDGGATWTDEQIIKTGSTSLVFLPTSILMTPSGKIIIVYTEIPIAGNVAGIPTYFKTVASVDNGLTWFDDSTLSTINDSYARTHGRAKIIPTDNEYGYKLGALAYFRYAPGLYKVAIYYSDDDGKTWAEGTPITMGVDNANETEFLPITSSYWIAVARNTEPTYFETRDGGTTWTRLGYYPSHLIGHVSVSPTLDKFYRNGKIYVLLGMFSRALDCMEWTIASAQDLSSNPNAWSGIIITDTNYLNNSGYQAPIANIEGFINVDNRISYAIIRENLDNPYSLINFSNIDLHKEAAKSSAVYRITSGVISILENEFEKVIKVDTEADISLDDLSTINGGYEGQTIIIKTKHPHRDVDVKSGTGNLILNGDYRLLDSNSKIILKKTGNYWYELAREHDTVIQQVRIKAGAVTVPKSNIPITLLIDTEDGLLAADDLTMINGGVNGQIVTFVTVASARDVTFINGGNLSLAGNYALLTASSTITLMHSSGLWRELCRSTNA